jgi:hypothetical protein
MAETERRSWTAPDGTRYRVTVVERIVSDGAFTRGVRRIEFATPEGEVMGDAPVAGYFSLDLADSTELERLWRWATGR